MERNIDEILKHVNKAQELQQLINVWNEIANNKYEYPLTDILYAKQIIRDLVPTTKGADIDKGEFMIHLT